VRPTVIRPCIVLAILTWLLAASTLPAAADPPGGDWTLVRKDLFKHYACKQRGERKGRWRIKTATWFNHSDAARYAGVYVALARGSNRNVVAERTSDNWSGGYIRLFLRGARLSDRLWMQGAYYGPAQPWSDGFPVRRLKRCASIA
jgi:hypothetical protein